MRNYPSLLEDFSNDFALQKEDGSICFDAIITYETHGSSKQLESEVQFVLYGETGLSFLQLLHRDVAKHGIPDFIHFDPANFEYVVGKGLHIKSSSPAAGNWKLTIEPINRDCNAFTNAELRQRSAN